MDVSMEENDRGMNSSNATNRTQQVSNTHSAKVTSAPRNSGNGDVMLARPSEIAATNQHEHHSNRKQQNSVNDNAGGTAKAVAATTTTATTATTTTATTTTASAVVPHCCDEDRVLFGPLNSQLADTFSRYVRTALQQGISELPYMQDEDTAGEDTTVHSLPGGSRRRSSIGIMGLVAGQEQEQEQRLDEFMLQKIQSKYDRFIDLFELYCARNIFTVRMYKSKPKRRQIVRAYSDRRFFSKRKDRAKQLGDGTDKADALMELPLTCSSKTLGDLMTLRQEGEIDPTNQRLPKQVDLDRLGEEIQQMRQKMVELETRRSKLRLELEQVRVAAQLAKEMRQTTTTAAAAGQDLAKSAATNEQRFVDTIVHPYHDLKDVYTHTQDVLVEMEQSKKRVRKQRQRQYRQYNSQFILTQQSEAVDEEDDSDDDDDDDDDRSMHSSDEEDYFDDMVVHVPPESQQPSTTATMSQLTQVGDPVDGDGDDNDENRPSSSATTGVHEDPLFQRYEQYRSELLFDFGCGHGGTTSSADGDDDVGVEHHAKSNNGSLAHTIQQLKAVHAILKRKDKNNNNSNNEQRGMNGTTSTNKENKDTATTMDVDDERQDG